MSTRSKRETKESSVEIAKILPNGEICFAGQKLIFKAPKDEDKLEKLKEALNTFIMMMSHLHGTNSGHYNTLE